MVSGTDPLHTILNNRLRHEAEEIARRMTYVELSVSRHFMDEYMSALFLPHTNLDAFPTVKHQMRRAKTWYAPE